MFSDKQPVATDSSAADHSKLVRINLYQWISMAWLETDEVRKAMPWVTLKGLQNQVETLECMRIYLHDHDVDHDSKEDRDTLEIRGHELSFCQEEENGDSIDWEPLERILGEPMATVDPLDSVRGRWIAVRFETCSP